MPTEHAIIAQARERERRFLATTKNHPGSPRQFDDLLLYLEDCLLDLRALAKVRGFDFQQRAQIYVESVVQAWRRHIQNSEASADNLRHSLHRLLKTL